MTIDPSVFYCLLRSLKFILSVIDFFLNFVVGFSIQHGWKKERNIAQSNYERSAQVVNIQWRAGYSFVPWNDVNNFIYTHDRYTNPNVVLQKDNITLHFMDDKNVYFCVTDPSIDVYNIDTIAFAFINQYLFAKQLVIMPISSMLKLGEQLGDPKNKDVILIQNTGRSGSTLLCQMFNKLSDTRVQSEPGCLLRAHGLYNGGKFTTERYNDIVKNLLRLQAKPENLRQDKRLVIKYPLHQTAQIGIFQTTSPYVKQIFSTRHPISSIVSFRRVWGSKGSFVLKYQSDWFWFLHLPLQYFDNKHQEIFKKYQQRGVQQASCVPEHLALAYGGSIASYLRSKDMFLASIIYETMMENPSLVTTQLFKSLDIPIDQVDLALTALKKHSQHNLFKTEGHVKDKEMISVEDWSKVDKIFVEIDSKVKHDVPLEEFKHLFEK